MKSVKRDTVKNARHVIAKYTISIDSIICKCEWTGSTEEFLRHTKEMKKIGDKERSDGLWKYQNSGRTKKFARQS